MKLGSKLYNSFIFIITIVVILTAISALYSFKFSINNYVDGIREQEFKEISQDIISIIEINGGLNSNAISRYAKNKNIDIEYINNNGEISARFQSLKKSENDKNYVTKTYKLIDDNGTKYGEIKISYFEDAYLYNKSLQFFYKTMLRNYAVILIISIIVGSIFAVYIGKKIINPISRINQITKEIKNANYNYIKKKYNIYELDELQSNLDYLSNSLSLQSTFRKNYAQDIAHELRTPLTNLLLHLEGIRDDIISCDDSTIELLIGEINRLNNMVDNLQKTFDDTENFSELKIESFDLKNVIISIVNNFNPKINEKKINILLEIQEIEIKNDLEKVTQIINNILSNAIKAVDENGKISIIGNKFHKRYVLRIIDNGVGISENDIPHIFERFFRVDSVRNSLNGGHGLGLSITKSLADLLAINISVNSTLGKGSEFILTFED